MGYNEMSLRARHDVRRIDMIFCTDGKKYEHESAVEIVRELERDAADYPHRGGTLRQFLRWSLAQMDDRVPQRELDVSDWPNHEKLALSYLYLREEYGLGEFLAQT